MRVSLKTEYALKTLLDLALNTGADVVPTTMIAKRQHIPVKFLEQILLTLRSGGLIGSRRGPHGGYYLLRAPKAITIGCVVRLTESNASAHEVRGQPGDRSYCPIHEVWNEIEALVAKTLDNLTIQDMTERLRSHARETTTAYVI